MNSGMNTWFTSDTHFGHARILEYCSDSRPFASVQDMDATIIENWNSQVGEDDVVYHLGDFAFMPAERVVRLMSRLNGRIHLVLGNHDQVMRDPEIQRKLAWSGDYLEASIHGQRVVMFHYPIHEWNGMHRGSYHLFGHVHGRKPLHGRSMDVGIDTHGMCLYSWHEVHSRLKDLPVLMHHGDMGK